MDFLFCAFLLLIATTLLHATTKSPYTEQARRAPATWEQRYGYGGSDEDEWYPAAKHVHLPTINETDALAAAPLIQDPDWSSNSIEPQHSNDHTCYEKTCAIIEHKYFGVFCTWLCCPIFTIIAACMHCGCIPRQQEYWKKRARDDKVVTQITDSVSEETK